MPSRAEGTPGLVLVPELAGAGAEIALPDEESHYVARVCRVQPGATVHATDGRGGLATLRVTATRPGVRARVEEVRRVERGREAWLLCGAPEGQRADWLVEKLAEFGVARLIAVDTERARWAAGDSRRERLERLAVAALRQSRRAWRLEVQGPLPLREALAGLPEGVPRWLADPDGDREGTAAPVGVCVGAVGPAEGFSASEGASIRTCGFRPISLADGRLRCETAALAWASWWARGG